MLRTYRTENQNLHAFCRYQRLMSLINMIQFNSISPYICYLSPSILPTFSVCPQRQMSLINMIQFNSISPYICYLSPSILPTFSVCPLALRPIQGSQAGQPIGLTSSSPRLGALVFFVSPLPPLPPLPLLLAFLLLASLQPLFRLSSSSLHALFNLCSTFVLCNYNRILWGGTATHWCLLAFHPQTSICMRRSLLCNMPVEQEQYRTRWLPIFQQVIRLKIPSSFLSIASKQLSFILLDLSSILVI